MFAIRPGRVGPPRCLDTMLRERWDDIRKSNNEEVERRKKAGIPLDDGDGPLEMLDEYEGNEDYKKIFVSIRSVSRSAIMETDIRIKEIADHVKSQGEAAARLRADLETFKAMKDFCRISLASVGGFVDDDGDYVIEGSPELTEEQVEFLDENGMLFALFSVAKAYQYLTSEKKRRYGLQAPSTCPATVSTAGHAPSPGAGSSVATGTRNLNGSSGSSTTTHAQEDIQFVSLGSANASLYSGQQKEN